MKGVRYDLVAVNRCDIEFVLRSRHLAADDSPDDQQSITPLVATPRHRDDEHAGITATRAGAPGGARGRRPPALARAVWRATTGIECKGAAPRWSTDIGWHAGRAVHP